MDVHKAHKNKRIQKKIDDLMFTRTRQHTLRTQCGSGSDGACCAV